MKTKTLFKQTALFFLLCLLSTILLAQTPPGKQWDASYGGNSEDYLYALQQTPDGGYILGGSSNSGISCNKTQENWEGTGGGGTHDFWLVKIDPSNGKQWDYRFGGIDEDRLYSLDQTTDGGYIL